MKPWHCTCLYVLDYPMERSNLVCTKEKERKEVPVEAFEKKVPKWWTRVWPLAITAANRPEPSFSLRLLDATPSASFVVFCFVLFVRSFNYSFEKKEKKGNSRPLAAIWGMDWKRVGQGLAVILIRRRDEILVGSLVVGEGPDRVRVLRQLAFPSQERLLFVHVRNFFHLLRNQTMSFFFNLSYLLPMLIMY